MYSPYYPRSLFVTCGIRPIFDLFPNKRIVDSVIFIYHKLMFAATDAERYEGDFRSHYFPVLRYFDGREEREALIIAKMVPLPPFHRCSSLEPFLRFRHQLRSLGSHMTTSAAKSTHAPHIITLVPQQQINVVTAYTTKPPIMLRGILLLLFQSRNQIKCKLQNKLRNQNRQP